MRTHTIHSLKRLFLVFILPLALLTIPVQALADGAHKSEGSKLKGYSHGSPHGAKANPHGGSPHGKKEGSGSKKKCEGKKQGSHGTHGYSKHGYGGVHGGGSHSGHGTDPFRHVLKFAEALGLTDAQAAQIKSVKFDFDKQRIMLKAQHEVAHMELDRLVHSGDVKESEMRAIADQIAEIKSKKIHGMVDAKISLLKLLTPEQRQKISELHSKH